MCVTEVCETITTHGASLMLYMIENNKLWDPKNFFVGGYAF